MHLSRRKYKRTIQITIISPIMVVEVVLH